MTRTLLHGWGRTTPSTADLVSAADEADVAALLASSSAIIPRGLGRSYGDAAQLSGGVVLDNHDLGGIGAISEDGVVSVGAGVSIDELLAFSVPRGWFVPVTPGTRQVSLGGAIASDVHGKNHHVDGSFGAHVLELRLVTPQGALSVSPSVDPDLFWATIGGMGLTGVVTMVTLRLMRIESDQVLVDTERFATLEGVMDAMASGDEHWRYSVAWVDCMTRGARMGRSILTRGEHAPASHDQPASLHAAAPAKLVVPFTAPPGLLNPLSIRLFNEAWYRSARTGTAQPHSLGAFFHPLDGVRDWNRLYGPRGFVQYQFCVPDAAGDTVARAIERLSSSRLPSFLAVLKRFGVSNPAPLSFPLPGWTLALDLPVGPDALPRVLDELDELVLGAGGRIYLAKDARLSPDKVRAMYPRLADFLEVKDRVDPERRLTSDLARRLHLVGK
ncbi:MAG TPA: FAD-binding oxidoreductase [Acidimicrobiales bacterium]|nr:FAD-binding oxidoreductase [Acidimicrobiales bacterium]